MQVYIFSRFFCRTLKSLLILFVPVFYLILSPISAAADDFGLASAEHKAKRLFEDAGIKVMNAAIEGGSVNIKGPDGSSVNFLIGKAGGQAVVVSELPQGLKDAAEESGLKLEITTVAPFIPLAMKVDGTWKGQKISLSGKEAALFLLGNGFFEHKRSFTARYGGHAYKIEMWEGWTEDGIRVVLLQSPAWDGLFGNHGNPYLMTRRGIEEDRALKREMNFKFNAMGHLHLAEERFYSVFAQGLAAVYHVLHADAALLNDYQALLAQFYNEDIMAVPVGHNYRYQGIVSLNANLPPEEAIKDLEERLNLPAGSFDLYLMAYKNKDYPGAANLLQGGLLLAAKRTGLPGTVVSPGYAGELKQSWDEMEESIFEKYEQEGKILPADHFEWSEMLYRQKVFFEKHYEIELSDEEAARLVPSEPSLNLRSLRYMDLIGVLNGMSYSKHASKIPLLRELTDRDGIWRNPETARYIENVGKDPKFKRGFNFGFIENDGRIDMERTEEVKRVLRRVLLMEAFPDYPGVWDNKDDVIHLSLGRLVQQKNFELLMAEAEHIVLDRSEFLVIVAGNPSDPLYEKLQEAFERKADEINKKAEEQEKTGQKAGRIAYIPDFIRIPQIYMAGADIFHVPSRFEPCGLVDIEAMWMGTLVVANRVGGLNKGGKAVFLYDGDPTSPESMRMALRRAYEKAVDLKKNRPEKWKSLQEYALKMDFTYRNPANAYLGLLYLAASRDVLNTLEHAVLKGSLGDIERVMSIVEIMPDRIKREVLYYAARQDHYMSVSLHNLMVLLDPAVQRAYLFISGMDIDDSEKSVLLDEFVSTREKILRDSGVKGEVFLPKADDLLKHNSTARTFLYVLLFEYSGSPWDGDIRVIKCDSGLKRVISEHGAMSPPLSSGDVAAVLNEIGKIRDYKNIRLYYRENGGDPVEKAILPFDKGMDLLRKEGDVLTVNHKSTFSISRADLDLLLKTIGNGNRGISNRLNGISGLPVNGVSSFDGETVWEKLVTPEAFAKLMADGDKNKITHFIDIAVRMMENTDDPELFNYRRRTLLGLIERMLPSVEGDDMRWVLRDTSVRVRRLDPFDTGEESIEVEKSGRFIEKMRKGFRIFRMFK